MLPSMAESQNMQSVCRQGKVSMGVFQGLADFRTQSEPAHGFISWADDPPSPEGKLTGSKDTFYGQEILPASLPVPGLRWRAS